MADQQLTTYIALFHHRDNAASAIRELESAGFTRGAFRVIGGGNGTSYSESAGAFGDGYGYESQSSLSGIGVPEQDREHLADGLAHGGTILVLEGAGDRADEIERIFSNNSTKKIDEKATNDGYVAPVAAPFAAATNVDETVIPVTKEELVVGKREVDRGGVRVFRRIVEEPVSTSVNLREEHVLVERRPVDRAVTEADLLAGDRTIELTETAEEPVVGKTARVVEEVHIDKQTIDRVETVRDTIRHTEVEVEQLGTTTDVNTRKGY